MEQEIRMPRMLSARLLRFYEARRKVGQLIYVQLRGEDQIITQLKKTSSDLDLRILQLENGVKCSIENLKGFNHEVHLAPVFLSCIDLENGIIDISKKLDGSQILDLTSGEIVGS
jgi:hypothetical protein